MDRGRCDSCLTRRHGDLFKKVDAVADREKSREVRALLGRGRNEALVRACQALEAWGTARESREYATLALTVFETLGMDPGSVMKALSAVRWPGRMERVGRIHFSGDHNPAGIESLREVLLHFPRRHPRSP